MAPAYTAVIQVRDSSAAAILHVGYEAPQDQVTALLIRGGHHGSRRAATKGMVPKVEQK